MIEKLLDLSLQSRKQTANLALNCGLACSLALLLSAAEPGASEPAQKLMERYPRISRLRFPTPALPALVRNRGLCTTLMLAFLALLSCQGCLRPVARFAARSMVAHSSYLSDRQNHERAARWSRWSYELSKERVGEDSLVFAWSANNRAVSENALGHEAEVERYYLEALSAYAQSVGKSHKRYVRALRNLANYYSQQVQLDKAEACLEEALQLVHQLDPQDPELQIDVTSLQGTLLVTQNRFDGALASFQKAKEALRNLHQEETLDYLRMEENIASAFHAMGEYTQADYLYSDLLNQFKANQKDSTTYLHTLSAAADVKRHLLQMQDAISLWQDVVNVQAPHDQQGRDSQLSALLNLALCFRALHLV